MSTAKKLSSTGFATLSYNSEAIELPMIQGSEGEIALDISKLRAETGMVTLDEGFVNTASCQSGITFLNGEKGILKYRGHPIEDLAKSRSFIEVCYLLVFGQLPQANDLAEFKKKVQNFSETPREILDLMAALPRNMHPMGLLSASVLGMSGINERYLDPEIALKEKDVIVAQLISQVKNLAAHGFRHAANLKPVESRYGELDYCGDFLWMMSGKEPDPLLTEALNILLILHADHEQNCSTSAVRLVGSSKANPYATISAGINALWGPLHGGANQAVMEMLVAIEKDGGNCEKFLERAKDKSDPFKLMGFGHRVYKNFDPRANIIKKYCREVLDRLGGQEPLFDVAKSLEDAALKDDYFSSRKLYPNVDFYSGILYKAMGIPTEMFTVMFSLGRCPGWLAQWVEMRQSKSFRIGRPRQIFMADSD